MPLLGFDFGDARIGVAIVPDDTSFALPLTTIDGAPEARDAAILDLVKKHSPHKIIVGLPITMRGKEGEQAEVARAFAREINEKFGVEVELIDERMTSASAVAAGAVDIDASSAAFILDTYLAKAGTGVRDEFDL